MYDPKTVAVHVPGSPPLPGKALDGQTMVLEAGAERGDCGRCSRRIERDQTAVLWMAHGVTWHHRCWCDVFPGAAPE